MSTLHFTQTTTSTPAQVRRWADGLRGRPLEAFWQQRVSRLSRGFFQRAPRARPAPK